VADATVPKALRDAGITAVCNCTEVSNDLGPTEFRSLRLNQPDGAETYPEVLRGFFDWMMLARRDHLFVLIHCREGSRALPRSFAPSSATTTPKDLTAGSSFVFLTSQARLRRSMRFLRPSDVTWSAGSFTSTTGWWRGGSRFGTPQAQASVNEDGFPLRL
jgi:hypothetical protein